MKTLINMKFSIKAMPTDADNATAAQLIKLTLSSPPPQGFDFATMRARNRVADALEKLPADATEIAFEDADFATARQCVEAFKWGTSHSDLLKFAALFDL